MVSIGKKKTIDRKKILLLSDIEVGGLPSRMANYITKRGYSVFYVYVKTNKSNDEEYKHDTGSFHDDGSDESEQFQKISLRYRGVIYNLLVNSLIVFVIWIRIGRPKVYSYGAYFISLFVPIKSNYTYGEELNRIFSPLTFVFNLVKLNKPKKIINSLYTNIFAPILHFWCFWKAKYIYIDPNFQRMIKQDHWILHIFNNKFVNFPHLPVLEFCMIKENIESTFNNNIKTIKLLIPSTFHYSSNTVAKVDNKGVSTALRQLKNLYKLYPLNFELTMIIKGSYYHSEQRLNRLLLEYPFVKLVEQLPRKRYLEEILYYHDIVIDNLSSPILNLCSIESLLNTTPVVSFGDPKLYDYLLYPPINNVNSERGFYNVIEKFIKSPEEIELSLSKIRSWKERLCNLPNNQFDYFIN